MEDAPPPKKSSNTLSVDRAAFLLLRVKKAFKKKRQQRKEKQGQLAGSVLTAQSRSCRKVPPPLLRSRTLPAIIVPGIPVVSLHTDKDTFQLDERVTTKSSSNRWSLLTRNAATTPGSTGSGSGGNNNNNNDITATIKSLNLPKDDIAVYRRKSSGSTPHSISRGLASAAVQHAADASASLMLQTCDDFECHADGSVLLRIPAPHVVAARAYRLAAKKRAVGAFETPPTDSHAQASSSYGSGGGIDASQLPSLGGGSGNSGGATTSGNAAGAAATAPSGGATGSSTTNTALTKLAKLLHQSSMTASKLAAATAATSHDYMLPTGGGGIDDAPRRLSWERRKDSSSLQRSASIDSFAEIVWSDTPRPSLDIPRPVIPFSKRPSASSLFSNCSASSQSTQLNVNYGSGGGGGGGGGGGDMCSTGSSAGNSRRESMLSPSSTRRNKMTRIINGK